MRKVNCNELIRYGLEYRPIYVPRSPQNGAVSLKIIIQNRVAAPRGKSLPELIREDLALGPT